MVSRRIFFFVLVVGLALIVSACNLSGAPSEEQIAQTATAAATGTGQPTRTPLSTSGVPTTVPVTRPTNLPTFSFPTAVVNIPTRIPTSVPPPVIPTSSTPVSIAILSPIPGNVVAGNVQIVGSASHPQFLQYQVEFGPDPNPGNLWFPATSAITTPVVNGILGIWNSNTVQDSRYQLRLRVYLRDGTVLTTVNNNITVQNRIPTPIPSPTQAVPRPIAAFLESVTTGDAPLSVQFTNQSTGVINSLSWSFGDGSNSSEINPRHTYGSPGLYTVLLTVTGPGGTSNVSRQINVTSPTAPTANFTMNPTTGLAPLSVQFTNQSTGNIASYVWFFSDGSTSTLPNPAHTFTAPGTYNVFLTVAGPGGTSTTTRQLVVTALVPPTLTPSLTFTPTFTPSFTPTFTATFTPTLTSTVIPPVNTETPTFTPTFTETPTNTTTAVPPTATFTPTFTETFIPPTATFTETPTNTSVPPTATFTPTATNTEFPAPVANFIANGVPENPLSVQFTNTSTGQIAQYLWQFGDGGMSNEPNPSYTYASGGTYPVTLTVTDTLNRSATFNGSVTVSDPVNAAFSALASGLTVQFTNGSTGPVTGYAWQFGDGNTSDQPNPANTYAAGGTYTVTLTVSDANGRTDSETQQVTVNAPVQAAFSAQVNGLTVTFDNQSLGPVTGSSWQFGDGNSSTEADPTYTYAAGGTYTVTLTVSDASGATNSISQQVTVNEPIQAAFSALPTNLSVQFSNQSTGPVTGFSWDFGDGGTSSEANPGYTYAVPGNYTVTLTVSDASGATSSTSQQVTVSAPVEAGFTTQVTDLSVQFTSTSTGEIAQYSWNFGDGGASAEANPAHTYAAPGSYTVTLVVVSTSGASDDQSQVVDVAAPLQANFSATPSDLTVQFTDQSTGAVTGWLWQFGDGATSDQQNPSYTYAAGGTYTVTLTVTDANGRTNDFSSDVTVTAPAVEPTQPPTSLVDTTPVFPDINFLRDYLRGIYANGVNSFGNRAGVFATAGDSVFTESDILTPFAGNQYNLGANDMLQPIIDWFNLTDLGGVTSFSRESLAVNGNWTAAQLLDPSQADPSCNGASPLQCELSQTLPVLMFVSIGENDARNGTDPALFQNALSQIISTIGANGTIPVLMTIPDDGSSPNTAAINDAIITIAQAGNLPLLNVARALNELPSENLDASPTGAGDLGNDAVSNYGINAVNYSLLRVLSDARNIIFPDA